MPESRDFSAPGGNAFTIPDKVYSLEMKMWAGGGGGQGVTESLVKQNGTDGGDSIALGFTATGGKANTTNGNGGARGTASDTFGWSGIANTNFTTINGNAGTKSSGGNGANIDGTIRGSGGNGDNGSRVYTASSTHVFNNETNITQFTTSSGDISVTPRNLAAEGVNGDRPLAGKYYSVSFFNCYQNANWTYSITHSQMAAGGGTAGAPYSHSGFRNKSQCGFDIWFETGGGGNTFIRTFSLTSNGIKPAAITGGGGGGGGVYAFFSRQNLIDSTTYAPGTSHTITVGDKGARGNFTGGVGDGGIGRVTMNMLIIPTVIFTDPDIPESGIYGVVTGTPVTFSWYVTGDANTLSWTEGPLGNNLLTSTSTHTPSETTTYTAVANGPAGPSAPASVTVYVWQVPTSSFTPPTAIDYGDSLIVSYETQYANSSITLVPTYDYIDGSSLTGNAISITAATSAEAGDEGSVVSDSALSVPITYNSKGPYRVRYVLTAVGSGGSSTSTGTTIVNIDTTPDNLNLEETDDAFKDQNPVYNPNIVPEQILESQLYEIDDIDIPVEIKSNYPIEVDLNKSNTWNKVRNI